MIVSAVAIPTTEQDLRSQTPPAGSGAGFVKQCNYCYGWVEIILTSRSAA